VGVEGNAKVLHCLCIVIQQWKASIRLESVLMLAARLQSKQKFMHKNRTRSSSVEATKKGRFAFCNVVWANILCIISCVAISAAFIRWSLNSRADYWVDVLLFLRSVVFYFAQKFKNRNFLCLVASTERWEIAKDFILCPEELCLLCSGCKSYFWLSKIARRSCVWMLVCVWETNEGEEGKS